MRLGLFYLCTLILVMPGFMHPYCGRSCGRGWAAVIHTVCRLAPCDIGYMCGPHAKMLKFEDEDRTLIVDLHNVYRNKVATGKEERGGNSKAANMMALRYDLELEFIAQCFSNSCPAVTDVCRITERWEQVGQNIFWGPVNQNPSNNSFLKKAVDMWYKEIKHLSANVIKSFIRSDKYKHITQLIWAKTERIGCGRTRSGDHMMVIVCNYAPDGNRQKEQLYVRGKPCSTCGKTACNEEYKGLCGDSFIDRSYKPPFVIGVSTSFCVNPWLLVCILFIDIL